MPKEIRLNAFMMNCVGGHLAPGQWRHGHGRAGDYLDPDYWSGLATLLERGRFDALFLGDVLGVYDVYGNAPAAAFSAGAQSPMNDPFPLVMVMAGVTTHLGFGITASSTYEAPYVLARRFTTLDHLTRGRIAWNIVTSYLQSGARSLGQTALQAHDNRYDRADECLDICYQLWEKSWDDDAVDGAPGASHYADPSRIRPVRYEGRYLNSEGVFQSEPSPQRTPVLFQAGGSARGTAFAARHAECVFVGAPTLAGLKKSVTQIRAAVQAAGRAPDSVIIFAMFTVIVDADRDTALARLAEYQASADHAGAAALLAGWTGVDLSRYAPDDTLDYVDTNAGQSALASFSKLDPSKQWTVRDALDYVAIGGRGPVIAGGPVDVADALQDWIAQTDIDGFNLACVEAPRTFADIVEFLVPELQRRGVYKTDYAAGTFRQKLFDGRARIATDHRAHLIEPHYKAGVDA